MRTTSIYAHGNQYRQETALSIIKDLESGKKPNVEALAQNASRPAALGFSDADLGFYRDRFAARVNEYMNIHDRAMRTVRNLNVKGSRELRGMSAQDRKARDKAYDDAKWATARIKAVMEFNCIITKIVEQREIAARPAPKPIVVNPVVETVMTITPAPTPLPTFKIKKRIKKLAKSRGETTLHSFEDIKVYQENMELCARILKTYNG